MTSATIIDYGMGNLRSVQKALERVGVRAEITASPNAVAHASHLVLPGVGAFGDAMRELDRRGLIGPIRDAIAQGRPFLGICLGLQLLFETSEEAPGQPGLGILPGRVVRFPAPPSGPRSSAGAAPPTDQSTPGPRPYKVPHMGWNQVVRRRPPPWYDIPDGAFFYFVHTYYVVPSDADVVALETEYGVRFCSAVARDNIFATQFHPEKSQSLGLRLLKQFFFQ